MSKKEIMDPSVIDQLTALVDALRAETTANSITPERLGALLQQIIDVLPELDDSAIANQARTALEAAQAAVNLANSALSASRMAEAAANDAVNSLSSMASDIADALSQATSAYATAQTASSAATQASQQVSALSTRVANLETFKTQVEYDFQHTPAYHSASWLVDEPNPTMTRYNAMKSAIGLHRMLLLHGFPAVSASVDNNAGVITVVFAMGDRYDIYTVTKGVSNCTVTRVSIPLVALQSGLTGNSIPHGRIGFESNDELFYIYNEESSEWQRISTSVFDISWIIDLDDTNAEDYAHRLLNLLQDPVPGTLYCVDNKPAVIVQGTNGSYNTIEVNVWEGYRYVNYQIVPDHGYDNLITFINY